MQKCICVIASSISSVIYFSKRTAILRVVHDSTRDTTDKMRTKLAISGTRADCIRNIKHVAQIRSRLR